MSVVGLTYPRTDTGNRRGVRHVDPDSRNVAAALNYRQTNYQRQSVAAATNEGCQRTRRRTLVHVSEHTDQFTALLSVLNAQSIQAFT